MIKLYSRNKHKPRDTAPKPYGFTVIELLIATSIFSVVLLVALNGFFQIGKLYYKGVATSQTQAITQKVMEDMNSGLQFASGVVSPTDIRNNSEGKAMKYICLGNARYTYVLGHQVNPSTDDRTDKFGLLRDYLPGSGCSSPFGSGGGFNSPTELLGSKMRLSKLCLLNTTGTDVNTSGSNCSPVGVCANTASAPCLKNLWLINLKVAYGDDDILTNPSSQDPTCNSALSNSQYCSVANLQTVINKGYGN